ncbi:MAG TPA: flagellar hook-length control protein FliK [Sphingomonas sp.]|nr:flagellar hook-length control protein FliK [Sphingomonas sp.]
MIQTAILSTAIPSPSRSPAAPKGEASRDFADSFANASEDPEPDAPIALPGEDEPRQDDAGTGNVLPPMQVAPDPAFVWHPIIVAASPATLVTPTAVDGAVTPTTTQPAAKPIRPLFAQSQPQVAAPAPIELPPANPLVPGPQTTGSSAMQIAAAIMAAMPPVKATVQTPVEMTTTETSRWATPDTPPMALVAALPEIAQPQPGTVASAAMVFGAAIQAATKRQGETDTPAAPSDTPLTPIGVGTAHEIAVSDTQQAPLDMRQERWPHAMIARIELLRDAADAVDTRIRLVPDALGAIDVSLKTDGDTVHVHFNAEQGATRTMLAEAQPRLAELAEARGLKLAQGSLGGGDAGASQQRAPAAPQTPNRPAPAAAVTADADTDDIRIA